MADAKLVKAVVARGTFVTGKPGAEKTVGPGGTVSLPKDEVERYRAEGLLAPSGARAGETAPDPEPHPPAPAAPAPAAPAPVGDPPTPDQVAAADGRPDKDGPT